MSETNRERILATLRDLGTMPYRALEEASGVPSGSFGRVLRDLVADGEVVRDDRDYQLPSADAQTLHYCAACRGAHVKGPNGWRCTAEAS